MNYTDYGYEQSRPLAERLGLPSAPAVSLASGGNPGSDDYLKFSTNIPGALTGGEDYYLHMTGRRGTDALEVAAASDRAFYDSRKANAESPYSAVGWHIGGLLNETGYDIARSARGAYRLATDSNTQAAAYNALKFAANNPGIIANNTIQGFKNFANKPFGQQADSVFKFAAGGFATAGTGKLGMLAVDGAVAGARATGRWVAPKAGELLENYMYRSGGLAYAVGPGVGVEEALIGGVLRSGPSAYRGGAYGRLEGGNGIERHHLPANSVSPISTYSGPAIQMDRADHILTSSHGSQGLAGAEYRMEIRGLIEQGDMRGAMAREILDVRRAAIEGGGSATKYNQAIREMLDYSYTKGYLNKR